MKRLAGTDPRVAQVGETTKDKYDSTKSPLENDNLGNIDWFFDLTKNATTDASVVTWYPRSFLPKDIKKNKWTRTEQWGPFDGHFIPRKYTVSTVKVLFAKWYYYATKVTLVGPAEDNPNATVTEAYTFIDKIGMYERYFDRKENGVMTFKHVATLNSASFDAP